MEGKIIGVLNLLSSYERPDLLSILDVALTEVCVCVWGGGGGK